MFPPTIVAIGGGGCTDRRASPHDLGMERMLVKLCRLRGINVPRACFIPTASGDDKHQRYKFRQAFGSLGCDCTDISIFQRNHHDFLDVLANQDIIYLGNGCLYALTALLRAYALDGAIKYAWQHGTILAGVGAGACCLCATGLSTSEYLDREPLTYGLGLIQASWCVALENDPKGQAAFRSNVVSGMYHHDGAIIPRDTALVYELDKLTGCVSTRRGSKVTQVRATYDDVTGPKRLVESVLEARYISD